MRKYEGMFILNTAGREDNLKDIIDRISGEITSLGGKVETVQKMEKRPFVRVADKKHKEGFYANFIFDAEPEMVDKLHNHFDLNEDVFRILVTCAPEPKEAK